MLSPDGIELGVVLAPVASYLSCLCYYHVNKVLLEVCMHLLLGDEFVNIASYLFIVCKIIYVFLVMLNHTKKDDGTIV